VILEGRLMQTCDPEELVLRRSQWFWGLLVGTVAVVVGSWLIGPLATVATWDEMRVVRIVDGRVRIEPNSGLGYRIVPGPHWGFRAQRTVDRTGPRVGDRIDVQVFDRGMLNVPVRPVRLTEEIAAALEVGATWLGGQSKDQWSDGSRVIDGPEAGTVSTAFLLELARGYAWIPLVGVTLGAAGRLVLAMHRLHRGRARMRDGACPECGHMMYGASPCVECGVRWRER